MDHSHVPFGGYLQHHGSFTAYPLPPAPSPRYATPLAAPYPQPDLTSAFLPGPSPRESQLFEPSPQLLHDAYDEYCHYQASIGEYPMDFDRFRYVYWHKMNSQEPVNSNVKEAKKKKSWMDRISNAFKKEKDPHFTSSGGSDYDDDRPQPRRYRSRSLGDSDARQHPPPSRSLVRGYREPEWEVTTPRPSTPRTSSLLMGGQQLPPAWPSPFAENWHAHLQYPRGNPDSVEWSSTSAAPAAPFFMMGDVFLPTHGHFPPPSAPPLRTQSTAPQYAPQPVQSAHNVAAPEAQPHLYTSANQSPVPSFSTPRPATPLAATPNTGTSTFNSETTTCDYSEHPTYGYSIPAFHQPAQSAPTQHYPDPVKPPEPLSEKGSDLQYQAPYIPAEFKEHVGEPVNTAAYYSKLCALD
eukprot:NODE_2668_length_1367_cov_40.812701_g2535_i0.p1 GENE.NODE_2668_length_1367_cov_40.812701_g2535_i0~~NODE_2668_length_1367_cov_40.812701_g2535_i0.p1  ORF type:complete len:409 (-),score=22.30 NODE_2668_length_1367_cov_40.812701_g2535_i0:36-1262(-)